ncbi:hypothetical protein GCM10018793_01260 [Streptomyces sulfonofaciens]|uniref:OmpR/PhoB-type domain-containing protein n=1 Tax=Streptomyces sulfonofaciens TaxID=68272 RepID=A0A919FN66_9ACTN|nr:tetratricopeptide repeat protein [Streptomyces sulfonofaciens]GHH69188.1 hypothetical protein GCM10018793_01260 [Streptomyces sulfonofaciens]
MEILLLGPVELAVEGQIFELASDKVRCLMAALALEAGRPIARDILMERLWDGDPPQNKDRLYSHVSRARRQLREAAALEREARAASGPGTTAETPVTGGTPAPFIDRRAHTYILMAAPDSIDRLRFRQLCKQAQAALANGSDERVVELLTRAKALWRSEPLAGLPGLWPARMRRVLQEEYLSAVVTGSAAALRLGRFEELVGELSELVERHPGDEQLAGHLILACHGSDRHSEAVRLYQRVSQRLRSRLGTGPGTALSRIYEGVVAGRPVWDLVREAVPSTSSGTGVASSRTRDGAVHNSSAPVERRSTTGGPTSEAPGRVSAPGGSDSNKTDADHSTTRGPQSLVPRERATESGAEPPPNIPRPRMLPRQTALEGRQAELEELTSAMQAAHGQGAPAKLVTVSGMPGVGKTALAVRAAAQLAEDFPHGELYVDLRGHDGSKDPLKPETALGILLRGLGAPAETVPVDVDECAAVWRAMLVSRRCVVVLDDAADTAQVTPMLPGESASAMVITSRRSLAGLSDAYSLTLEALPQKHAIGLFRRLVGEDRTRDIGLVARIVRLCGYLPLAIELVAMRFRGRPTWKLSTLSERLARSPGRLDELRDMDDQRGVIRAFSLSYRTLGLAERRAFRLLSLHPGSGFSAEAAAALLDLALPQTERLLEALLSCHLLQETAPNRHRFHDLLAEYASLLAEREESSTERDRAVTRLTSFFTMAADQAERLAYPHRLAPAVPHQVPPGPLPFEPTAKEAQAWFEIECGALLHLERQAHGHGRQYQAAVLAQYLTAFLREECHWADAKAVASRSLEHWRSGDQRAALCRSLLSLTALHARLGEYAEADAVGGEALALARSLQDRDAEAETLRELGVLRWYAGDNSAALRHFEMALEIRNAAGQAWEQVRLENNIAMTLVHMGEKRTAQEYFQRAIAGFREVGDSRSLGVALGNSGSLYIETADLVSARASLEEALPLLRSTGSLYELSVANMSLGFLYVESGDAEAAIAVYRQSLVSFRALNDRRNQSSALNGLGSAYRVAGRYADAIECHRHALDIAIEIGAAHEQTVAYRGLGEVEAGAGGGETAADHLRAAIALADRTHDLHEAALARRLLAEVQQSFELSIGPNAQA